MQERVLEEVFHQPLEQSTVALDKRGFSLDMELLRGRTRFANDVVNEPV